MAVSLHKAEQWLQSLRLSFFRNGLLGIPIASNAFRERLESGRLPCPKFPTRLKDIKFYLLLFRLHVSFRLRAPCPNSPSFDVECLPGNRFSAVASEAVALFQFPSPPSWQNVQRKVALSWLAVIYLLAFRIRLSAM